MTADEDVRRDRELDPPGAPGAARAADVPAGDRDADGRARHRGAPADPGGSGGEPPAADAASGRGAEDLTCGTSAFWLWRLPTLMIVAGAFWPAGRFWLWIPAFLVAGAACAINARRCGRVHCYATGPLYLGAGAYLVLALPGWVPFQFVWFLVVVVGLSVLAQLAERLLGRYRT